MDFVVVGLGLGALAILAGVILLGWVTGRWQRVAATAATPDEVRYARAMAGNRQSAGQALLCAGGAILLATIGALAGSLDDQTGAYLVTTTATVAAVGFLIWEHLSRLRSPLPSRPRSQAAATPRQFAADPTRLLPAVAADEPGADLSELPSPVAGSHWDDHMGDSATAEEAVAVRSNGAVDQPEHAHRNGSFDQPEANDAEEHELAAVLAESAPLTLGQDVLSAAREAAAMDADGDLPEEMATDRVLTLIPLADYRDAKAARVQSAQRSQAEGGGSMDE